jgi:hypothetical protein
VIELFTFIKRRRLRVFLALAAAAVASVHQAGAAELKAATLKAWEEYQRLTEARIEKELRPEKGFLVQEHLPLAERESCRETLAAGGVFVQKLKTLTEEGKEFEVPDGMIHHWFGSIFVPRATLSDFLPWLQDYAQTEKYFIEVERSRLLFRDGDKFKIFFRIKRKKVVTAYYNTEYEVEYRRHGPGRASSRSYATKIAELDEAGTPREQEKPPGNDRGFLWRLTSYWRFLERDGGVAVECETISLSRSIPIAIAWLIGRYVQSIPRDSLESTLLSVRDGYHGVRKTAS